MTTRLGQRVGRFGSWVLLALATAVVITSGHVHSHAHGEAGAVQVEAAQSVDDHATGGLASAVVAVAPPDGEAHVDGGHVEIGVRRSMAEIRVDDLDDTATEARPAAPDDPTVPPATAGPGPPRTPVAEGTVLRT